MTHTLMAPGQEDQSGPSAPPTPTADRDRPDGTDAHEKVRPVEQARPSPDPDFEHALRLQMAIITGE